MGTAWEGRKAHLGRKPSVDSSVEKTTCSAGTNCDLHCSRIRREATSPEIPIQQVIPMVRARSSYRCTPAPMPAPATRAINLDFHFGRPSQHRYTPSARPRGPDVFVAHASGSRHRQRGAHGGHTRLNRPGSEAFLAHLSLPVLVLREPYAVTLAARQPAGTGSAQIRCSIAPNRRRVR